MSEVNEISKIKLPNNTQFDLKDAVARQGLTAKVDISQGSGNVGKILKVNSSGNLELTVPETGLPLVTSSDNGKVLEVSSGEWSVGTIKADKTDTVLDTTLSRGRVVGTTIGSGSFAFGSGVEASGTFSHAEGDATIASGTSSHTEGYYSTASGSYSHAEGSDTIASGSYAHAEGQSSIASAAVSHVEGRGTIANAIYMHSAGLFNYPNDTVGYSSWLGNELTYYPGDKVVVSGYEEGNGYYICLNTVKSSTMPHLDTTHWKEVTQSGGIDTIEAIGYGTNAYSRKNIRALDTSGNEYLAGALKVGCNDDSTGGQQVATINQIVKPVIVTLDNVSKTDSKGSYLHTTNITGVTVTMKPIAIEVSDTSVFMDNIVVTCGDGTVTLSCAMVYGTSTVSVTLMEQGNIDQGGLGITSAEYNNLSNRLNTLDDSVVHLTGTEIITGFKKFENEKVDICGATRYKYITFHHGSGGANLGGIRFEAGNATNVTKNQFGFYQYSPNSPADTGTTGKYEMYLLPSCTSSLSSNASYDIMTSKDTEYLTTYSDFLTAGTNVTISEAQFYRWGKIAQVRIKYTRSAAVTSDTASTTIATLKSGYRPKVTAAASAQTTANGCNTGANGACSVRGQITASTTLYYYSTFILP